MSRFENFKKKLSLKKFHEKVDEFEEKIEEKLRNYWGSLVRTISSRSGKTSAKKIKSARNVRSSHLDKKEKKSVPAKLKTKKISKKPTPTFRSVKAAPKSMPIRENKRPTVQPSSKTVVKPSIKKVSDLHMQNIESPSKNRELSTHDNASKRLVRSSTPQSSLKDSKKRGRPKARKGRELEFFKTPSVTAEAVKKSKNTKSAKKPKSK